MSASDDNAPDAGCFPTFDRQSIDGLPDFSIVGDGQLGGKAAGLAFAKRIVDEAIPEGAIPGVSAGIPRLIVLTTDVFERFMRQNNLYDVALDDLPDDRMAHAFIRADLPPTLVGDLRAMIGDLHTPLAVRSSSLLEDALNHPFAGVYATKMIPNNQSSVGDRFKKLSEAVKFVWASTFFRDAKRYMRTIGRSSEDERMAVIIQEVVGQRFEDRFYPIISGVARTHNYYPTGPARPEDGVVNLAIGLGKTIVDGGISWSYSPRFPRHRPPFASTRDLVKNTQTRFWAVSMRAAPYDPINEAEHLTECTLDDAEWDDVLRFAASTYDAESDRLTIGTGVPGPRVITFSRILELDDVPLNPLIERLAAHCKGVLEADVEIEFAMTLDRRNGTPARFGFLQVRPMMVGGAQVDVDEADLRSARALVASETVLGNGEVSTLVDVVYVKPTTFEARHTPAIAAELECINESLLDAGRPYVLMGFGRWGSSDPWLGIPTTWPQISGARVIVEATLPEMNVDASQGSHFFHNMISFHVQYFTVRHDGTFGIDWDWLDRQPAEAETRFARHVRLASPLYVRVDGRVGRGVILRPE